MNLNNSFKKKFFTKQNVIKLCEYLLTSLTICVLMAGIECTCIYAIEVTRFDKFPGVGTSGWVWGRDYGIALAIAWPLSWLLTNLIPLAWVKLVFEPAEKKNGAPSKAQKVMGFVMISFTICFFESLIMSLIMYTIDTRVVLPPYMNPYFEKAHEFNPLIPAKMPVDWIGGHWARVWGVAIGICFPCALVITSLIPMGYKKLFAKIENKKFVKSDMPYNEATLKGKEEYLADQQKDSSIK